MDNIESKQEQQRRETGDMKIDNNYHHFCMCTSVNIQLNLTTMVNIVVGDFLLKAG